MKLHLDAGTATHRIAGYGLGFVTVNEEHLRSSVIVMPENLVRDWPPRSFEELRAEHFELVAERGPEIVLLGTGAAQRFPSSDLLAPLVRRRIGVEVMDTGAACRTYNIIMAEGRAVAAALLMIHGSGES